MQRCVLTAVFSTTRISSWALMAVGTVPMSTFQMRKWAQSSAALVQGLPVVDQQSQDWKPVCWAAEPCPLRQAHSPVLSWELLVEPWRAGPSKLHAQWDCWRG